MYATNPPSINQPDLNIQRELPQQRPNLVPRNIVHNNFLVQELVNQLDPVYRKIDNRGKQRILELQRFVYHYPNTGEVMNECMYEIIKQALKKLGPDFDNEPIGNSHFQMKDHITQYNRIRTDAGQNVSYMDWTVGFFGDFGLSSFHILRDALNFMHAKLMHMKERALGDNEEVVVAVLDLGIMAYKNALSKFDENSKNISDILQILKQFDKTLREGDATFLQPMIHGHEKIKNYARLVQNIFTIASAMGEFVHFLQPITDKTDKSIMRNRIRMIFEWLRKDENMSWVKNISETIQSQPFVPGEHTQTDSRVNLPKPPPLQRKQQQPHSVVQQPTFSQQPHSVQQPTFAQQPSASVAPKNLRPPSQDHESCGPGTFRNKFNQCETRVYCKSNEVYDSFLNKCEPYSPGNFNNAFGNPQDLEDVIFEITGIKSSFDEMDHMLESHHFGTKKYYFKKSKPKKRNKKMFNPYSETDSSRSRSSNTWTAGDFSSSTYW